MSKVGKKTSPDIHISKTFISPKTKCVPSQSLFMHLAKTLPGRYTVIRFTYQEICSQYYNPLLVFPPLLYAVYIIISIYTKPFARIDPRVKNVKCTRRPSFQKIIQNILLSRKFYKNIQSCKHMLGPIPRPYKSLMGLHLLLALLIFVCLQPRTMHSTEQATQ